MAGMKDCIFHNFFASFTRAAGATSWQDQPGVQDYLSTILSQNAIHCEVYAFQKPKIVICMTVDLAV
jgi:hypothetical protein